jgi:hypothetical protein
MTLGLADLTRTLKIRPWKLRKNLGAELAP